MVEKKAKIIVLQGPSNSGKTTTIRLLVEKLLASGEGRFVKKSDETRFKNSKGDFMLPVLYRGHLLGVATYGDDVPTLDAVFNQFEDFADIIICAAHSNGSSTGNYIQAKNDGKCVITIAKQKTISDNDSYESDDASAEALLDEIRKALG